MDHELKQLRLLCPGCKFLILYFMHSASIFLPLQALSAQEDLEKAKEELKNAVIMVPAPLGRHAENEHDEHDENHAEASAELSNEGVSHLDLRSEEERVTEAQKNQRVKQQLQVRVWGVKTCHSAFVINCWNRVTCCRYLKVKNSNQNSGKVPNL